MAGPYNAESIPIGTDSYLPGGDGQPLLLRVQSFSEGGNVMTCNVGGIERPIRIVLGIVLLGVGAFAGLPVAATTVLLVVGTIALVTGAIGYCPAWALLGFNTCPTNPPRKV